jgi:hypothetical protein
MPNIYLIIMIAFYIVTIASVIIMDHILESDTTTPFTVYVMIVSALFSLYTMDYLYKM